MILLRPLCRGRGGVVGEFLGFRPQRMPVADWRAGRKLRSARLAEGNALKRKRSFPLNPGAKCFKAVQILPAIGTLVNLSVSGARFLVCIHDKGEPLAGKQPSAELPASGLKPPAPSAELLAPGAMLRAPQGEPRAPQDKLGTRGSKP